MLLSHFGARCDAVGPELSKRHTHTQYHKSTFNFLKTSISLDLLLWTMKIITCMSLLQLLKY